LTARAIALKNLGGNLEAHMQDTYSPEEQGLVDRWQAHMDAEFVGKDAAASVATMTPDPSCNHAPVLTGGSGAAEMLAFYRDHFIPKIPADMQMELISRTVGQNRVIDEQVIRFTHDVEVDWMLPGVAPTGKRVEAVFVVVVQFDAAGKVAHERIYWDQATVLVQLGLIDPGDLPVSGVEAAHKVIDQHFCASNDLIRRAARRTGRGSS
jgi:carboxymethylenebutenolidase